MTSRDKMVAGIPAVAGESDLCKQLSRLCQQEKEVVLGKNTDS